MYYIMLVNIHSKKLTSTLLLKSLTSLTYLRSELPSV